MWKYMLLTIGFFVFLGIFACTPTTATISTDQPGSDLTAEMTELPASIQPENTDPAESSTATQKPEATPGETQTLGPAETDILVPTASPTMMPPVTNTAIPSPTITFEPTAVLRGNFYDVDENHQGSGTAVIIQTQVDEYTLKLENFSVTSGPDLHVILAEDDNPYSIATLGDYLDLGELKSTSGDQAYTLPNGVDLEKYGSVVIYCVPFQAIFAIAPVR